MQTRHLLSLLFILLLSSMGVNAQKNTLSTPDVSLGAGKEIPLRVNLDNTADIVAVQFTLTLPEGLWLDPNRVEATERTDSHTISMRDVGDRRYKAVIMSTDNSAITGRTGAIMTVPMSVYNEAEDGAVFQPVFSDVAIVARDGSNLATGFSNGTVTVAANPDFEVSNVTVSTSEINPQDIISVSWKVENIGSLNATGGWNEQIFLESADGTYATHLTTVYHDQPLAAGGVTSRSAEVELPEVLGIDGDTRVKIVLNASYESGEPYWLTENNTAYSESLLNVSRRLYLSPLTLSVEEQSAGQLQYYLYRSGSTLHDETFAISFPTDSRLTVPTTVTIPSKQSGVLFYVGVKANGVLDDESEFPFTISGEGYDDINALLTIEDDTYPALKLTLSSQEVEEGGSFDATISILRALKEDLPITLTCDLPQRFKIPSPIVIAAGATSVTVKIEAIDDDIPDIERDLTFTASAPGQRPTSVDMVLADNDIPALELSLSPATVSEGDGPLAVTATLRRTDNIDKLVTIRLEDDSNGNIFLPMSTFEMQPGVEEATFNLGPVDNSLVDGERTYIISASVFIASCSCNATNGKSGGTVSAKLTVTDNDGPMLSVASPTSMLREGEEMDATVSVNTELDAPLTVALTSDHASELQFPETVIIPAGEKSASFTIKAVSNAVSSDGFNATIFCEAEGYAKAAIWLTVTDQTLPDAQLANLSVSPDVTEAGGFVTASLTLLNSGAMELPELTKIEFFLNTSSEPVASIYLQDALAAGESVSLEKHIEMPAMIGKFSIYAVVNRDKEVKEISYSNNTTSIVEIATAAPFSAVLSTDKSAYLPGEKIVISGHLSGVNEALEEVEIYVINSGYRHTLSATTDENGDFTATYEPYAGQYGKFAAGACYPGENLREEQAVFNVYGISRDSNDAITCEATFGEPFTGTFGISNPGILPLTGVKVNVVGKPSNCEIAVSAGDNLNEGESTQVEFSINPLAVTDGSDWQKIELEVTTAEGVSLPVTLYYYCRLATGQLKASVQSINTTMVKGASRDFVFEIGNNGKGDTGKITLALPSWMAAATPKEMASLAHGESATVILRLTPTDDMQLNVPVTGSIGINCANGTGLSLPYSIETVSDSKGTLTIDVCDEYTYYTAEAPHVQGAKVTVSHPTTGAVIASGETGANGKYSVELPEGYYAVNVTADKHDSYRNNVMVDPGTETVKVVNLSIQAITVDWKVEETEVEDEYEIKTTVNFETNVPVPVIVTEFKEDPKKVFKEISKKDPRYITLVIINHGWVKASGVSTSFESEGYDFERVGIDLFDINPGERVEVPYKVTPTTDEPSCVMKEKISYYTECGPEGKWVTYEFHIQVGNCPKGSNSGYGMGSIWGGTAYGDVFVPNGPYTTSPYFLPESDKTPVAEANDNNCDPCLNDFNNKLLNCGMGLIPGLGCAKGIDDCYKAEGGLVVKKRWQDTASCVLTGIGCIADFCSKISLKTAKVCDAVGALSGGIDCLIGFTIPCDSTVKPDTVPVYLRSPRRKAAEPSYITVFREAAKIPLKEMSALRNILVEIFGSDDWVDKTSYSELDNLLSAVLYSKNDKYEYRNLIDVKPEQISKTHFEAFIERINNSTIIDDDGHVDSDNYINDQIIQSYFNEMEEAEAESRAMGYASTEDMWNHVLNTTQERLEESSSSVCASISLQFDQSMVMTRQAFRGTLTVFNGNDETPMENVRLALTVKDSDGNVATEHEFQIDPESLNGFGGELSLTDSWTLDPQTTGVAKILFIPTKYAAPTKEEVYSFGGTLTYVDPFTGLEVSRNLFPVSLTVKPSPNLNLTYFVQRDIFGDDPLTTVVEPSREAEFSLLINNVGYGDATDVRILTEQPKITDNEKGLAVDFEIVSSQINGGEKNLVFGTSVANSFGDIKAKDTAYAQWWMKSDMLGHFTDYDIKATHITSYDNPDLSLLNEVSIHELIRSLAADQDGNQLTAFMTNDIPDADDYPDRVYLSDGSVDKVSPASAEIRQVTDETYVLTVIPGKEGWNYGNLIDPTYGVSEIVSVVRQSDGKAISLRNFWQTDRTLRDGIDPIYENRIHFADLIPSSGNEEYVITFGAVPDLMLEVASIEGAPIDGTPLATPLEAVNVMFNKYIDAVTFSADDVEMTLQGEKIDASRIAITTDDSKTFHLDLSGVNENLTPGFVTLTVKTADIVDADGFNGIDSKSVSWNYYPEGSVLLGVSVSPENAGTIYRSVAEDSDRITDSMVISANYGENVSLKAVAANGYEFSQWSSFGESYSMNPEIVIVALANNEITAVFSPKHYAVDIDPFCEGGSITGSYSGIYPFGEEITLIAIPDDNFVFTEWVINGENLKEESTFNYTVKGTTTISALFAEKSGIECVTADRRIVIYSVDGLVISSDADAETIRNLAPGIYIINGVKYIVR